MTYQDNRDLSALTWVLMDSFFILDDNREIIEHNSMLTQLVGVRGAERSRLKGTRCYERLRLEICQEHCIALRCMKEKQRVRMNEIRGQSSDGRNLVLELSAVPIQDDTGQVRGALVVHRDVTDERRLKDRFLEAEASHRRERSELLRVIDSRDNEIRRLKEPGPPRRGQ